MLCFTTDHIVQFDKFVVPINDADAVPYLLTCDFAIVAVLQEVLQEVIEKQNQIRDRLYAYLRSKNPYYFLDSSCWKTIHDKMIRIVNSELKNGEIYNILFTMAKLGA